MLLYCKVKTQLLTDIDDIAFAPADETITPSLSLVVTLSNSLGTSSACDGDMILGVEGATTTSSSSSDRS